MILESDRTKIFADWEKPKVFWPSFLLAPCEGRRSTGRPGLRWLCRPGALTRRPVPFSFSKNPDGVSAISPGLPARSFGGLATLGHRSISLHTFERSQASSASVIILNSIFPEPAPKTTLSDGGTSVPASRAFSLALAAREDARPTRAPDNHAMEAIFTSHHSPS